MPRETALDHSLALLADPYRFIARRCAAHGSDVFQTRLLLTPTLCLTGPKAAELFYDQQRFERSGAAPEPLRATLFGQGGVQTLDGAEHRRRKAMFMAVMSPASVDALLGHAEQAWQEAAAAWSRQGRVVLYDALHVLLTQAVCRWAGLPLSADELGPRSRQLVALFDSAGSKRPWRHLQSRLARQRAEAWLTDKTAEFRNQPTALPADAPAHEIVWHRGSDDRLLAPRLVAVELLNLLRPTVAVSVFIVFAAHALQTHPLWRERLAEAAARDGLQAPLLDAFAQEVRRFYPFFPAVVARVRRDFAWQGMRFQAGMRAMLDLYGTNHDPRAWEAPDEFRPERFITQPSPEASPFAFVPQGGSDAQTHHRCPGEGITVGLMKQALDMLVRRLDYQVPTQDLAVDMKRLPALPRDRFLISDVRWRAAAS